MSDYSNSKVFKIAEKEDLDFISGGAKVVEDINHNHLQTDKTCMCNCGCFEPHTLGITLNICDNCKHAKAPCLNSEKVYCSKQTNSAI